MKRETRNAKRNFSFRNSFCRSHAPTTLHLMLIAGSFTRLTTMALDLHFIFIDRMKVVLVEEAERLFCNFIDFNNGE